MTTPQTRRRLWFLFGVVLLTVGYLWRCQFSVDLTDEPFYLAPGWKLFSLGDVPFVDEIYNGPRHSDLLNHLLIAPWLSYSVLLLRAAAVILYSFILAVFVWVLFHRSLGWIAFLCYAACLLFDVFLMPTWSYNWWCRNFLILHSLWWVLAHRRTTVVKKRVYLLAAGLSLGIATVAYHPMIVMVLPTAAALLWHTRRGLIPKKSWLWVTFGFLATAGVDLAYCLQPRLFPFWVDAYRSMKLLGYAEVTSYEKFSYLLRYLLTANATWLLIALSLSLAFLKRAAKSAERFVWRAVMAIAAGSLVWIYSPLVTNYLEVYHFYVAFAFLAGLWVICRRSTTPVIRFSVACALAASLLMGMSSVNRHLALLWLLPGILVPAMAELQHRLSRSFHPVLAFAALFIFCGALYHQRHHSYYDVPPGNCSVRLSTPPLQGLKTSPERAAMVEEIAQHVSDKPFVLSFADFPGPYYFGVARPAVDTVMVEADAKRELHLRSLTRMMERNRIPQVIFQAKVMPWYWGIHHPLASEPLVYPGSDPYIALTRCVTKAVLADRPEYRIIRPDPARFAPCIASLKTPSDGLVSFNR